MTQLLRYLNISQNYTNISNCNNTLNIGESISFCEMMCHLCIETIIPVTRNYLVCYCLLFQTSVIKVAAQCNQY